MGLGNSREWFGLEPRPRYRSPSPGGRRGGGLFGRNSFRQRRPSLTTQTLLSTVAQPFSYRPVPSYAPLQPMSSPFLPIAYNNYPAVPQIPPQYMMMSPQRISAAMPMPYMSPSAPISTPYVQPAQMQPVYSHIGSPTGFPGGNIYYPSPYPSVPGRLLTDWTGGGKISPGFLGPPI